MDICNRPKQAGDFVEHAETTRDETEHRQDGDSKSEDVKTLQDMYHVGLNGTLTQLQDLYNTLSGSYDEHCEKLGKETGARNLAKIVAKTQPNREARILDVGCGNGLFGKQLSDSGYADIDGLDFAQSMLDLCKSRNVYKNYINASIEPDKQTPGIEDNTYDVICLNGVISGGHITCNALPEMARMVKPGGSIVFNITSFWEKTSPDDFGLDALRAKLESFVEAGLFSSWKTIRDVYYGATGEEAQIYILHVA